MSTDSLEIQLRLLKEDIMKMGRLLQEQIYKSIRSLTDKNLELAQEVIKKDDILDKMELDIEKKCLYLIALKQPLAGDLRFIGTNLRIIVDLERMGDHAEDIAKIAIDLYEQAYIKPLIDIPKMTEITENMVKTAMKALIDGDVSLAMELVEMEKQVDSLYDEVFKELLTYMMRDHDNIPQATSLLLVAGHLERIADHATNLGEMVIYIVEGRRVDINVMARS
ncbi:MAG: phosphate signaling complex protein PhoU [Syntrophomonas sp.]|nr:phosphate signaling complex protein PhoU [Syntrophomonas sp.]